MNSMSNESVRHGQDRCWLDKFFKLSQHGTNVRTEICGHNYVHRFRIYFSGYTEFAGCIRYAS